MNTNAHRIPQFSVRIKPDSDNVYSENLVDTPETALEIMCQLTDNLPVERLVAIFLKYGRPLSYSIVSQGGVQKTVFSISYILRAALLSGTDEVIIGHNHAVTPIPSDIDWEMTKELHTACHICGLSLVDHIIWGGAGPDPGTSQYVSMRRNDREHKIWLLPLPDDYYDKPKPNQSISIAMDRNLKTDGNPPLFPSVSKTQPE